MNANRLRAHPGVTLHWDQTYVFRCCDCAKPYPARYAHPVSRTSPDLACPACWRARTGLTWNWDGLATVCLDCHCGRTRDEMRETPEQITARRDNMVAMGWGAFFSPERRDLDFCPDCSEARRAEREASAARVCVACPTPIGHLAPQARTCSPKCRVRAHRNNL